MSLIRANRWEMINGVAAGVIYVDTVADLQALPVGELVEGQAINRAEFWSDTNVGGIDLVWKADEPTANHNGGTIIDPLRVSALDQATKTFNGYHSPVAGNFGCFVSTKQECIFTSQFGALEDTEFDSASAYQAAINLGSLLGIKICATENARLSKIILPSLTHFDGQGHTLYPKFLSDSSEAVGAEDANHILIENVSIDSSEAPEEFPSYPLNISRCDNVTVRKVTIKNSLRAGIRIGGTSSASKNVKVIDCEIDKRGSLAPANRNGIELFRVQDFIINKCTVYGSGIYPDDVGIILQGCRHGIVSDCLLQDNASEQLQTNGVGGDEILIDGPDDHLRTRFIAINNVIARHTSGGSATNNLGIGSNCDGITVSGGSISGAAGPGIEVRRYTRNIIIQGVNIFNNKGSGVSNSSSSYGNIIYSGLNVYENGRSGIVVNGSEETNTGNITISACTVRDNGFQGAAEAGINFFGWHDNVRIFDCIFTDTGSGNQKYAVSTEDISTADINNLTIYNNDLRGNVTSGWRTPKASRVFAWDNREDDPSNPEFVRLKQTYSLGPGETVVVTPTQEQSYGLNLEAKLLPDPLGPEGHCMVTAGVSAGGLYRFRATEMGGLAGASGLLAVYAKG